MHLSPREIDKLLLHNAGFLAQKRLARGVRLNHPESVALIATQLLEFVREGRSVAELMDLGRKFLGRRQLMPGIPSLIHEVQVEGTFPDGTNSSRCITRLPAKTEILSWPCTVAFFRSLSSRYSSN